MDGDVFGMIIFFGFLAAIILVPIYLKERTKQSAHQLISQALDKGQPLDPALIRQLTETKKDQETRPRRTLGSGIILLALAAGFVGSGFWIESISGSSEAFGGMMIPAAILGALGVAFILLALIDYSAKKRDQ